MKTYPNLNSDQDTPNVVRFIVRERQNDVTNFNNLPSVFMRGRKVGKIPSSSTDVAATDRIGDFNITTTYRYDLVDDGAGGAEWVRSGVSIW